MREIKFRAWLELEGKYQMTYDLAFEEYAPDNDLLASVERLMQYTGFKDKNGVEIYEGDIVRHTYEEPGEPAFNDVICVRWNVFGYWSVVEYPGDFEVIGNIYENSELLKGE